ncbi:DUF6153 family protein [Microbacterium sp. NPDC089987]|uniref:DUF6153 family protein n=1 Tax=Microbacterium limosum TaxID=3079935 RepID=A0AAU0MHX4_9MICO|nr:DUF6153 family protein [Microbacterium sp. Y20]WOQ70073.1 DUF6153 family protein [Microbacterium sp. Y20]
MNVARRGLRPQISLRGALLLATAALTIIVGLLGMHTFTADAAGHRTAAPAHAVSENSMHSSGNAQSDGTAAPATSGLAVCDDACMSGPAGGHADMITACVLALLAGLVLLLRPGFSYRLGPPLMSILPRLRPGAARTLSRAPSLTLLSISRT